jgi:hypothetical protein
MSHEDADVVWVVVQVISGIPDTVEVYRDQKSALAREQVWRKDLRPDYDEVGVFEVEIGVQSSD